MKIKDHLLKAVRGAGIFNPDNQVAPICILWTDRDRQWESVIPRLQAELPELSILGDYCPERRTGPAIWLRCVLARTSGEVMPSLARIPLIYLPGVSRQDLRALETCPDHLKPLAELQYRGAFWSQVNAKDWTILAYLKSDLGGLGLNVAQDTDTKDSMRLALEKLLDENSQLLVGKRLDQDYFNSLLTGGDAIRDLLQWLDQDESFRASRSNGEWKAFTEICKSQFGFNPHSEGVLGGAAKLASCEGPWRGVWSRFCEAPKRYAKIPGLIKRCRPPSDTIFWDLGEGGFDGWPQWNEDQEKNLGRDLLTLKQVSGNEARLKIIDLEHRHGPRRGLVWAELDQAPLARCLEHLATIAELTQTTLAVGTIEELAANYSQTGWRVEDALVRALAEVSTKHELAAVTEALLSVYLPWAEESSRYLQKLVDGASYPGGTCVTAPPFVPAREECVLFVDGLRLDLAKRLIDLLERGGLDVLEKPQWSALPSVTATGKPAVTPVRDKIRGKEETADFEPGVAETGKSLKGGYNLRKLLSDSGWSVIEEVQPPSGTSLAWYEFGDIDREGHSRGWKLAHHLDTLLKEVKDRVAELLVLGWRQVRIVTDHGWLLLPGGLPKVELPSALTENKWGRCASVKAGSSTDCRLYPWYWNPHQYFALADGVSCFKNGVEYAHGGLSLPECLTLELTVAKGIPALGSHSLDITDVVWKGMRLTVAVEGSFSGLILDIRLQPGDSDSTVVIGTKPFKGNGTASVVVERDEYEGVDATIVIVDAAGALITQLATVVGGGNK